MTLPVTVATAEYCLNEFIIFQINQELPDELHWTGETEWTCCRLLSVKSIRAQQLKLMEIADYFVNEDSLDACQIRKHWLAALL